MGLGMEIRFNLWPGDETFGGHFKVGSSQVLDVYPHRRIGSFKPKLGPKS